MSEKEQRPTRGQQRILQLCCRVTNVLRATGTDSGPVEYMIVERGTGRHVMTVAPAMVLSLADAGWIMTDATWAYRVTESGIAAANGPTCGE